MDEGGEEEDHISTFVHDWRVAVGTAYFAREIVFYAFRGWVVPFQTMVTGGEIYVCFVEDGCPLEGCRWMYLLVSFHTGDVWLWGKANRRGVDIPCCV